ncbi:MAG: SHOCT domain-containing protein [Actinomycetales bacterium]|nr:SHOCT domain-containing protein [Actinomycetales bacterium]
MPRLGRAVARTAVIAGTATAVSGKVAQRQADKQEEKESAQAAAAPAPAAVPETDAVAEIERLGALKEKGLLTDEEFAAAKAKILGI